MLARISWAKVDRSFPGNVTACAMWFFLRTVRRKVKLFSFLRLGFHEGRTEFPHHRFALQFSSFSEDCVFSCGSVHGTRNDNSVYSWIIRTLIQCMLLHACMDPSCFYHNAAPVQNPLRNKFMSMNLSTELCGTVKSWVFYRGIPWSENTHDSEKECGTLRTESAEISPIRQRDIFLLFSHVIPCQDLVTPSNDQWRDAEYYRLIWTISYLFLSFHAHALLLKKINLTVRFHLMTRSCIF